MARYFLVCQLRELFTERQPGTHAAVGKPSRFMLLLSANVLRVGTFLCDVPTPALVLDTSTVVGWYGVDANSFINENDGAQLENVLFVHTSVLSGRDPDAGAVGSTTNQGASYSTPVRLAELDCSLAHIGGADAFVALGLNNHLTGGYYWGRASGPGAAMPAMASDVPAEKFKVSL